MVSKNRTNFVILLFSIDINECAAGTDTCGHSCHNYGNCGGYYCTCPAGYTLDSNGNCPGKKIIYIFYMLDTIKTELIIIVVHVKICG